MTQNNTDDRVLQAVFWDMDGTLIDSEPIWHESEVRLARMYGGHWTKKMAEEHSGIPVPVIAREMVEEGVGLTAEQIEDMMFTYVEETEAAHMPWIPGATRVLTELRDAGVPCVLVTTSPRDFAEKLMAQAPAGAFVDCVSGDDDVAKKPDPAPYILAAKKLGIDSGDLSRCIAFEDSRVGVASAAASGAITIAQTICMPDGPRRGPQNSDVHGYDDVTADSLERLAANFAQGLAQPDPFVAAQA
ncbi:MAG: HAD family phosphatase [Bifidobacterium sp.]|nr:HAD family phosphatase [Bifidobacterium sp.]